MSLCPVEDAIRSARRVLSRRNVSAMSARDLAELAIVYLRRKGYGENCATVEDCEKAAAAQLRKAYGP